MKENSTGRLTARLAGDAAMVKATTGDRIGTLVRNNVALLSALAIAFDGTLCFMCGCSGPLCAAASQPFVIVCYAVLHVAVCSLLAACACGCGHFPAVGLVWLDANENDIWAVEIGQRFI